MDFVSYINSVVHITLLDNFYYVGKIVSADSDGIEMIDKTGKRVTLRNSQVQTIREVSNGKY